MALFISVVTGTFIFLLIFILFIRRSSEHYQVHNRVQGLQAVDIMSAAGSSPGRKRRHALQASLLRIWDGLMLIVGNRVKTMTPHALYQMLDNRIMWVGKQYNWHAGTFFFIMILCGAVCALAGSFLFKGPFVFIQRVLILLLLFFCGAFLPWFWLSVQITKRRQSILSQLSDMMDLVCISVQAGLSFDAALTKVGTRMQGPLIEETNRMLRDIRMGMTRRQAMTDMAQRCNVDSVYLFVAAVLQSESLGVNLANTLKIQSDSMRDRHRQMVREKAMKLPVKLIFPLALFIFPTIFIVVLGPVILTVLTQIKGHF